MVVAGGAGPADEETAGDAAAYGEQGPGVAREGGGTVPAAGEGGPSGGGLRKGRHQRLPLQITNPKVQHPNHSILDNLLPCFSLSSPSYYTRPSSLWSFSAFCSLKCRSFFTFYSLILLTQARPPNTII